MLRHVSLFARWDFLVFSLLKMWRSDIRCCMVARVCPWMLGNAVRPGLFWDIYQSCWKGHSNLYEPKRFDAEHAIAIGYIYNYIYIIIYIVTLGLHSQFSCANVRSKLPQRGCFHWFNVPTFRPGNAWFALRHHLLLIYMFLFPSTRFPMIPNDSKWVVWGGLLISYVTFHRRTCPKLRKVYCWILGICHSHPNSFCKTPGKLGFICSLVWGLV